MNTGLESDSNFESTIRIEDTCLPQNVIYQYFIKCIINLFILIVWVFCLHTYMCVLCDSLKLSSVELCAAMCVQGSNSGPLQEQGLLTYLSSVVKQCF